jgi:hypothetical protein
MSVANLEAVQFEIRAHRANDAVTLRPMLAARPTSLELDVGVVDGRLAVAHDVDHSDASGLLSLTRIAVSSFSEAVSPAWRASARASR